VLKTVIFSLQVGFTGNFVSGCSFKLAVQILTSLFSLTVLNFVVFFFKLLDRKFNEDSKNVLKTVIFSLQVGFTGNFVADCSLKLGSGCSNFDIAFSTDCTKFCSVFFKLLNRKFNEDFKNVLQSIIFSLQVGFTDDFIIVCSLNFKWV